MERFMTLPGRRATVLASAVAVACFGAAGAARADATTTTTTTTTTAVAGNGKAFAASHLSPRRAYVRGP
jgi:hypothetical protein